MVVWNFLLNFDFKGVILFRPVQKHLTFSTTLLRNYYCDADVYIASCIHVADNFVSFLHENIFDANKIGDWT
jgi:hypothetical protein